MTIRIRIQTPGGKNSSNQSAHKETEPTKQHLTYSHRLQAVDSRPRRHPLIHFIALILSLGSLGIWVFGIASFEGSAHVLWFWLDIVLGVFFVFEFITRSGFHWHHFKYVFSHIFDFVVFVELTSTHVYFPG